MREAQDEQITAEDKSGSMPTYSRKKGTIALMLSSYVSLALGMVKGLVMIPLYLRYIDARLYGAWLATGSIITYFGLCHFGLGNVMVQRVASNYGKKDFDRLGSVLGTGLTIGIAISCLPVLFSFVLAPWVAKVVHIAGVEASQLRLAFILAAAGTSLMLIVNNVGGVVVALQRQIVHGAILVVGDVLGIVAILVLLMSGYGLLAIPAGTLVWGIISVLGDCLYLYWFLKKKMPRVAIRFKKEDVRDLSFQSIWQFASQAAVTLARQSDNLIVATFIDPRFCVILTVTRKTGELLTILTRHFARAFLPSLAHLHGEGGRRKLKKIIVLMFKATTLMGICLMGGYLFFNKNFVALWVGSEFFGGDTLTKLLYIYGLFLILGTNFYVILFAKNEMIIAARAYIAEALVRIPLSIYLVRVWGIKGIIVAGILAIISTSFWIQVKKLIEVLKLSKDEILDLARILILQIVISIVIGMTLSRLFEPQGFVELIVLGGAYGIVLLIVNLIVEYPLFSEILRKLREQFEVHRGG